MSTHSVFEPGALIGPTSMKRSITLPYQHNLHQETFHQRNQLYNFSGGFRSFQCFSFLQTIINIICLRKLIILQIYFGTGCNKYMGSENLCAGFLVWKETWTTTDYLLDYSDVNLPTSFLKHIIQWSNNLSIIGAIGSLFNFLWYVKELLVP